MDFEWDEEKNRQNKQAKTIFDRFTVDIIDDRFPYEEIREVSLGMIENASILVVVHTDRNVVCRIISARPALKKEKIFYEKEIRKAFDA